MAEEIGFQVKVGGTDSLSSLKKEFKDLQKELEKTEIGTTQYQKTLEKLGKVKDDIGDLRDAISALNPEGKVAAFENVAGKLAGGFQAATGAAALFGAKSEELEKQLLKVQAATALAEGIQSVVGLSDAFVVLKTAVMATNPVFLVLAGVIAGIATAYALWKNVIGETAQADALLNSELERQAKNQESINNEINRQLELDKLLATSQSERTNLELEAEIKKYSALRTRQILLQKISDKSDEQAEELIKLNKEEADSYNRLIVLKIQASRQFNEEVKQAAEDRAKDEKDRADEAERKAKEKAANDYAERQKQIDKELADRKRQREFEEGGIEDLARIQKETAEATNASLLDGKTNFYQTSDELDLVNSAQKQSRDSEQNKVDLANEKIQAALLAQARLQAEENFFNAAQGLSEAFFQAKLNQAEGNAIETDNIRKKQFQAEKAFSVARAIIDGYRSVVGALAQTATLGPAASVLAASNAILAAANVAKILSTKYESGSTAAAGGGGGGVSLPSGSANQSIPMPTIAAPVNPQASTQLNAQGYNVSKVVVVEKDITTVQNRINRLKVQATY